MPTKYVCICKFCGKEFLNIDMFKDVCFNKQCQDRNKAILKRQSTSKYSIYDVERMAIHYSRQLGRTVTYGQVSLLLDKGIKVF